MTSYSGQTAAELHMYQLPVNILFHHAMWRLQFTSNLRVKKETQPFYFLLIRRRRKWVHTEGRFLFNTTTVHSSQSPASRRRKPPATDKCLVTFFLLIYDPVIILSCEIRTFIKHVIEKQCFRWIQTADLSAAVIKLGLQAPIFILK